MSESNNPEFHHYDFFEQFGHREVNEKVDSAVDDNEEVADADSNRYEVPVGMEVAVTHVNIIQC